MRREQILHILDRYLPIRNQRPGDVVTLRPELCLRSVPAVGKRRQIAAHKPGPRCVVDVVHITAGAEDVSGVKDTVSIQIQLIVPDELLQIRRAEMRLLCTEGIFQVKAVHPELVRIDHYTIIRDPLRHPVVSADGLQPPDLVFVVESDPIGLIGTVPFQQTGQPQHAFPGAADIGQNQNDDIFFPDTAGDFLLPPAFGRPVCHQRIRCQNTRVRGNGLRGRHADIGSVDAGSRPDAVFRIDVRAGGITKRCFRKFDLQVGEDTLIFFRLILRLDHNQFLDIKMTVVRPGDHGGTVVAGILSDQYGSAGHRADSSFSVFRKYRRFTEKAQDHCTVFPVEFHPGSVYNDNVF